MPGFEKFWSTYPSSGRKVAKAACRKRWKSEKLEPLADQIVSSVAALSGTRQWTEGYSPAPLTFLNQRRWEDGNDSNDSGVDVYGVPL